MVLETESLKLRCQQDYAASEVLGKKLFYASLLVSGGSPVPWLVASSFQFLPASPHGHLPSLSLSVYLCAIFLLIRTPVTESFLAVQWLKC